MNIVRTPHIQDLFEQAAHFPPQERLSLANLLLESVLAETNGIPPDEHDWHRLGLAAFEQDWDNADDAIYDNWRTLYGVSTR